MLDREQIKKIIPHRDPFLFIDRIIELEPGKRAVGIKKLTGEEYFFKGHFPDYPIMPGVLIVEALAQVGAVAALSQEINRGKIVFLAGIDNFRFKKQVCPGDEIKLEVKIIKVRGPLGKGSAIASVDDEIAAQGELMFAVK
ncbi:MAG: 3-hydroxyacyl-ACP dehydratase FabZ [Actinomycetota bacterium]